MSLNFDMSKLTYYDSSILKDLYDEARAIPPVNPNYKSTVYSPQEFKKQK